MSMKNGVWYDVREKLPDQDVEVLAVKETKSGRRMCIASCMPKRTYHDYKTGTAKVEPYWVCSGGNNIIYWMPLPKMPEE